MKKIGLLDIELHEYKESDDVGRCAMCYRFSWDHPEAITEIVLKLNEIAEAINNLEK